MRVAFVLIALSLAGSASAQETERYRLEKTADGYVRMDTQTGATSICRERDGQLFCQRATEQRVEADEVERLAATVKALEERVAKLENSLAQRLESSLPTEEEFEKTMGYMERFFRGFIGIVREIEREDQKPGEQRT